MMYFPLTPHLKRLYMSKHTSQDIRWHKDRKADLEGVLRHPADDEAWRHFDEQFLSFPGDPRNVRLGIALDGFNSFGNMSNAYSMWDLILVLYNFPP